MTLKSAAPYELAGDIAVITLNNPPVNALALVLRLELETSIRTALDDAAVEAIVLVGAGRGFCAGGDINEFDLPAISQAPLMDLFLLIENSHKPIVAALHGVALGGGLELALACHGRVAQEGTQIGLPEVHLGLVPGAGGTQRLPRLIGAEAALTMIVQGRTHAAQTLRHTGLFDQLTEASPTPAAIDLAKQLALSVADGAPLKRSGQIAIDMANAQAFFAFARATVKAQAKGLKAPVACVDCVELAVTRPLQEGLEREFNTFWELRGGAEFAGLRHVFLAERKATDTTTITGTTKGRTLDKTVVVGGGIMGTGIAISLLNAGFAVTLIEREQSALERGLSTIHQHFDATLKKGRLSVQQVENRMGLIQGAINYEAVKEADLVIEAIFEDLEAKRHVFEHLSEIARPGTLLATNTSMLDVDQIATYTDRPEDVLGLHFFSPAHVMKLLEVVQGKHTSQEALATAMTFARRLGKTAVVSGVCEGFIGNRMLQPYLMQAGFLLDEGALPHQVDRAIENWGMAMGPFRMSDMAGNDLGQKIRQQRLLANPDLVYSNTFDAIVALGRAGQKVGRGWYDYIPGQRAPQPSAEVNAAVAEESRRLGLTRRAISDEEIVQRLLLSLVNEGAQVLEEGIALRASDIDVVYTAGYGFPRWRGGPMFAADQLGLGPLLAAMRRFSKGPSYQRGEAIWQPSALLARLADQGLPLSTTNQSELS